MNHPYIIGGVHKHSLVDINNKLTFPVCLVHVHAESSIVLSVGSLFTTAYATFPGSTGGAAAG